MNKIIQINLEAVKNRADIKTALVAKYGSLGEACRVLNVNYTRVYNILKGVSQAITHPGIVDAIMEDLGLTDVSIFKQ